MGLQGRLDGRKITAGFPSPTNYTPTAVGNENVNKVSAHLKGIDAALASTGGGGKFDIKIEEIHPDDTNPATNCSVAGRLAGVAFSGSSDNIVWCQFITNAMLNASNDILFEVCYVMSSAESSKKVSLNADVWVFSDNDDPSKAADFSGLEDEISVPNDGKIDKLGLTNIKIGNSALSGAGQLVVVKLWRDVDGTTPNHTGDFQLMSLRAYQA